jgi:NTE family protein
MKVGLALGGGGARGFAHIGVLHAMEERGIEQVAVAGCSMGGIVGAFIANGAASSDIREAFADLKAIDLFDWSRKGGLIGGKGLEKQIAEHLPDRIDQLKIPFRSTAVDIQAGRPFVFFDGELVPALRATSAVPGIFSPVEYKGRVFVDGGLLINVPIEEVRSMTTEPVLAVDVTPPPDRKLIFEDNRSFLEKLKAPFHSGKRPLFFELLTKAYEIPAAILNDVRVAGLRPEILIKPRLDPDLKPEDFDRMDDAIEAGYGAAVEVLDALDLKS